MTLVRLVLTFAGVLLGVTTGFAQFVSYEMVSVGDPGNTRDANGYGRVPYEYRIGKFEVTIGEYASFLNAVAQADPYGLYSESMTTGSHTAGIARTGSSGAYAYSLVGPFGATQVPVATAGNRPMTNVSWFDAARFANWMANGQPVGPQGSLTTENGAYALNGVTFGTAPSVNDVNPNTGLTPLYRIPTEDEWYKSAYYKGGGLNAGYWTYATLSDTPPGNVPGTAVNQANYMTNGTTYSVTQSSSYVLIQNYLTDVGAFSGSPSAYGTFDQSGNVQEWNDLAGAEMNLRGIRGGFCFSGAGGLSSAYWDAWPAANEGYQGFRLSSPVAVPEPSTYAMALAGIACGGYSMFRRRQRA